MDLSGLSRLCYLAFFVLLIVLATILDVVYEYRDKRAALQNGNFQGGGDIVPKIILYPNFKYNISNFDLLVKNSSVRTFQPI